MIHRLYRTFLQFHYFYLCSIIRLQHAGKIMMHVLVCYFFNP